MPLPRPRSLFAKTLVTIGVVSACFQAFTLFVIGFLLLAPMGQRSADDLAALMVLSAQTWVELPPATRVAFERELAENHSLVLTTPDAVLSASSSLLPYFFFLEDALSARLDRKVSLGTSQDSEGQDWYWADIPTADRTIRMGFVRDRIGVQPPIAFLLVVTVGTVVLFTTAVALVRRLTAPLERLALSAQRLGAGERPEPLPETGAEELAALAGIFNRMSQQVQELLANRTTLLAGVSHDLRTPLARIRLALAMMPANADSELVAGMERDLEEMNRLLGQFLVISRELEAGAKEPTDVRMLLEEIVGDARRSGADVALAGGTACRVVLHPLALQRIVVNLLENAVRYGEGKPVSVEFACRDGCLTVRVLDRGPGIPEGSREAVFRPFHRLEQSRSSNTGGSGLGLAIARQLANANGWQINLSAREGGGTQAQLRIPCGGRSPHERQRLRSGGGCRIIRSGSESGSRHRQGES